MRQGNVLLRRHLKFQVFTAPVARLLHTFFAQMGPSPPQIFHGEGGGGGGLFNPRVKFQF